MTLVSVPEKDFRTPFLLQKTKDRKEITLLSNLRFYSENELYKKILYLLIKINQWFCHIFILL